MYCKQNVIGGKPAAVGGMVVVLLIAAIFFFGFWLPGCIEMEGKRDEIQKKHREFDREWNRVRQDQDKFFGREAPGGYSEIGSGGDR